MLLMDGSDKRKVSLYFSETILDEIAKEATRQDRSLSWVAQKAWSLARNEIRSAPSAPRRDEENGDER
jgi:uncharacterized small protein (TIGR04563 family)